MIIEKPTSGKPLVDELRGLRSFRLGRMRIIHAISERDRIDIVTIGPRKRVYEETYRIISRKWLAANVFLTRGKQPSGPRQF